MGDKAAMEPVDQKDPKNQVKKDDGLSPRPPRAVPK